MTIMCSTLIGASSTLEWSAINWQAINKKVYRLQMRIAKAFRDEKYNKAKALQWLLTHSLSAKLLAVKRVTQNPGSKTPGVDNITWSTPKQKLMAALSLKRKGYKTKPLKRIYIPKKQSNKKRPLSIPVIRCRAQQSLYLLALQPIAETLADYNAYGFRPLRSCADAIDCCFKFLSRRNSAQYILEADIKSCFDSISHQWLLNKVPMDKVILSKWLKAGYIDNDVLYPTDKGTPQGGIISPTLLVITLAGLETAIKAAVHRKDKVNVSIYADDFIVTGATQEVLENKVKPAIESFLKKRALSLSQDKTKITNISKGFNFLGANIRKYNDKLIIQPSKDSVITFLKDIRKTIKSNQTAKTDNLIHLLNQKIRGWSNYHRHICAKKTFRSVSYNIFQALWLWAKRRHPTKNAHWIKDKYFRKEANRNWIFSTKIKGKQGTPSYLDLMEISKVAIKRHTKIRSAARLYDPAYQSYLNSRINNKSNSKFILSLKAGLLIQPYQGLSSVP